MNATHDVPVLAGETDFITFYVGDTLFGIEIALVDEINRHVDTTPVPHAPPFVLGVLNLRGDVVTILDLAMVLGVDQRHPPRRARTVIVRHEDERIGLRVDRVADVVRIPSDALDPVPSNIDATESRFFRGVWQLDHEILTLLDVDAVLKVEPGTVGTT